MNTLILPHLTEYVVAQRLLDVVAYFGAGSRFNSNEIVDLIVGPDHFPRLILNGVKQRPDAVPVVQATELGSALPRCPPSHHSLPLCPPHPLLNTVIASTLNPAILLSSFCCRSRYLAVTDVHCEGLIRVHRTGAIFSDGRSKRTYHSSARFFVIKMKQCFEQQPTFNILYCKFMQE